MEAEGPSWRARQAVGEAGESSSHSRKRARLSPGPQHPVNEIEQEPVSEADNDGINGQDSEEVEEEEEEQSESEGEYEDEEQSEEFGSDGDDVVVYQHNERQSQQGSGGEDQPPQPRVVVLDDGNDDDDMPFSFPCTSTHQCSSAPAPVPPPPSSCSESSVVKDATVNSSALDCGVCYLPLKPPIFQCIVGHVVCSSCHEKMGVPRRCHVCRSLTPGGYQRCHAMEQLVDSIRVPCPYAAYGCTDRPVYHNREGHAQACVHAPCHCPGKACRFVGSMVALLHHFAAMHRWPCTTEDKAGTGFQVKLRDGFNFVTAIRAGANEGTSNQYLFLLNVERAPFGRTITAFCIHPHHTKTATLRLICGCIRYFDMCCMHRQSSEFKVACTDLSNGLPDPSKCFLFIMSRSVLSDEEFTKVIVVITKTPI